MTWDLDPRAAEVLGDQGPWGRHLARAWRACAEPVLSERPPLPPAAPIEGQQASASTYAYWGPLLHLLCFGLGWPRPDLGLARWTELGRPTDDPVLRVVNSWWGPCIPDFLAWAAVTDAVRQLGSQIAGEGNYGRVSEEPVRDLFPERRREADWRAVWEGGTDTLHLTSHALTPIQYPDHQLNARPHWPSPVSEHEAEPQRMTLVLDEYSAWHASLWHYRPAVGMNGRSIRTDVVCKPIGWLGEYRQSRISGAWFRGAHRWHALGI